MHHKGKRYEREISSVLGHSRVAYPSTVKVWHVDCVPASLFFLILYHSPQMVFPAPASAVGRGFQK